VLVDFVDGADVGMIQSRGAASLPLKAINPGLLPGKLIRQEFQGHLAPELAVFGLIDHAHPAAAEPLQNPIMRDNLAGHPVCTSVSVICATRPAEGSTMAFFCPDRAFISS